MPKASDRTLSKTDRKLDQILHLLEVGPNEDPATQISIDRKAIILREIGKGKFTSEQLARRLHMPWDQLHINLNWLNRWGVITRGEGRPRDRKKQAWRFTH